MFPLVRSLLLIIKVFPSVTVIVKQIARDKIISEYPYVTSVDIICFTMGPVTEGMFLLLSSIVFADLL